MEFGIVLHGSGVVDFARAMEELREAGFRHFEYSYEHVATMERNGGSSKMREAADLAESLGLLPAQLHGPSLERGCDLGNPDPKVRRRSVERSCRWIEYCAELRVPVMVEHPSEFHPDFDKTMELVKSSFREVARCAEEHGVKVALENEFDPRHMVTTRGGRTMVIPPRVGCTISELSDVIRAVDSGSLGICLDLGHANLQRPLFSISQAIREAGSLLIATHLHDNMGWNDDHLLPLQGNIPWSDVIEAFREIHYQNPLILEIGGLSVPDEQVRTNRLRLARLVAEDLSSTAES